jgi:hypothetical protein
MSLPRSKLYHPGGDTRGQEGTFLYQTRQDHSVVKTIGATVYSSRQYTGNCLSPTKQDPAGASPNHERSLGYPETVPEAKP